MRPTTTLQSALCRTTETLARELGNPTAAAPDWTDFEWSVARAVAAMHGVSPLLSRRLAWTGPARWSGFLADQHRHTARRHERVRQLLDRLQRHTLEAGIVAVALKGAALHALGIYAPGERPMADVDLLVRPQDAGHSVSLLESLGFRGSVPTWKEQVFTPLTDPSASADRGYGEHVENPVKIELHQRICERLPWSITDVTASVFPVAGQAGLNAYPSTAALMLHLSFHAAGNIAFQALRLLHLHDIAALAARMTAAEWDQVFRLRAGGALWWLWPPLYITSLYFELPADVLAAARHACPRRLVRSFRHRTLSDVSYSYLPIDAFPGIEWSRSAAEVARYMGSRLCPDAEHVAARRRTLTSETWTQGAAWPALSQRRRVLSWVVARPGRPVTLHAVNAALAEP